MKGKVLLTSILVGIFLISVFTGIYIFKINNEKNKKISEMQELQDHTIKQNIENSIETEETLSANSSEEKITPHTRLILRKYYEDCGHSINEYVETPVELINMTKEELEEEYKDWNVYIFSEEEVIMIKNVNGFCNEHYSLKDLDGYVAIYKVDKNGNETLQEKTAISTRYLTQTDKSHLESGIKIYGTENLNKYIEDFE